MKTAIVTGAARGIGEGISRRLVADGYRVGLIDQDADQGMKTTRALRNAGGDVAFACADVANEDEVGRSFQDLLNALGRPTVLVNNAGFARDVPFSEMTSTQWDQVQGVHMRGTFLCSRAVLPAMRAGRWGRIICISSISANGHSDRANYCAAKAGMEGFVRALSVELGPLGITVNAIAPGLIVTEMTLATAARRGLSLEDHLADASTRIPVGRPGQPEDIAQAVSFFASEQSGFITGQTLTVSGGVIR